MKLTDSKTQYNTLMKPKAMLITAFLPQVVNLQVKVYSAFPCTPCCMNSVIAFSDTQKGT